MRPLKNIYNKNMLSNNIRLYCYVNNNSIEIIQITNKAINNKI